MTVVFKGYCVPRLDLVIDEFLSAMGRLRPAICCGTKIRRRPVEFAPQWLSRTHREFVELRTTAPAGGFVKYY